MSATCTPRGMTQWRPSPCARGFTLIEMIITMVVIGVLVAAAAPAILSGVRAYDTANTSLKTLSKLRYATERMAREIRDVRRRTLTPTEYDISTMSGTVLTFFKQDTTQVTLTSAPPIVTLAYPVASGTLTDQVSNLTFRYYDSNGALLASPTPSTVAFIEIDLQLTDGSAIQRQRTRVALRNQQ